jgi:prepilin-type processing-associated H-X9-DG protein
MAKKPDPDKLLPGRANTLYVGGHTLVRGESGKATVVGPIASYINITDGNVAEFWSWLNSNEAVIEATQRYNAVLAEELMAWGVQRNHASNPPE